MTRETAIKIGKSQSDGRCVFRGTQPTEGAHLFPSGDYPMLSDYPENIFAMSHEIHDPEGRGFSGVASFDIQISGFIRPVSERVYILETMTLDEFRPAVRRKLRIMHLWCDKFGVKYPEPVKPMDFEDLILRGRMS